MPANDPGELPEKRTVRERIEEYVAIRRLRCVECGRLDPGGERGWTLRLDGDGELCAFCPDCDEEQFGDS